ncbi:MAG TPA: DUF6089 family protein [Chitinophagaceae bacterium]|nr:DUF6089 family protein [Chitinophagaceae bacterium]
MRKLVSILALVLISNQIFSQVHLGVFAGSGNYQGDLIDGIFIPKLTRFSLGIKGEYELKERLNLRAGLTFAQIAGNDRYSSKDDLKLRNLSFESNILEFHLGAEFHTFSIEEKRWSPYLFGGLAVYHYNPYVLTTSNEKIFLQPLSTEGQGLSQYPDRKPYSLTQLALPFGGGVKFALTDNIRIGVETGWRKLFTDYLDDISTTYADENDLRTGRSERAVQLAYRGDEVAGGNQNYPAKGAQRGGSEFKDWYYLTGFTLTYRLGNGGLSGRGGGRKGNYGCPKVPM